MALFKASFYNRCVPHNGDTLLYNGKTGALFRLPAHVALEAREILGPTRTLKAGVGYSSWAPPVFDANGVPEGLRPVWDDLLDAGMFISADHDEREQLRKEFVEGQTMGPFMVTVTTTLDCNMRCYYCYQNNQQLSAMSTQVCEEIVGWIKAAITEKRHRRLFLEWYGGEPMLNREAIELISASIVPFCDENAVAYKASMLCNGTRWPDDVDSFIRRTRLSRVQFSMDGPERFHNKRRGIVKESVPGRTASYDELMETVSAVIGKCNVSLRINVDPAIGESCLELVDVMAERGWLDPGVRFFPYIALITDMTEHCGFIGKAEAYGEFRQRFPDLRAAFFEKVAKYRGKVALDKAEFFPRRRLINCAAVNENSVMFGPNGLMYKCGLDVGDHHRAHSSIGKFGNAVYAATKSKLSPDRWNGYDPFTHSSCKECQYLPMCLGGCPRAQMDRNEEQIRAQSERFEKGFETMIREYVDAPF